MDLRGIANGISSTINPNVPVIVKRSTGYTIGTGQKQIPSYATAIPGFGQIQALDANDVKQLDGLNIQGVCKALYLRGVLAGVIRPDSKGGDIVTIAGADWLVVKVLEGWPTWTKCAIVLQGGA
jgi:hypothetical protein